MTTTKYKNTTSSVNKEQKNHTKKESTYKKKSIAMLTNNVRKTRNTKSLAEKCSEKR